MRLSITSEPAAEPVTLTEAKAHLRVTGTDDDTILAVYIKAARVRAEMFTRRAFVTQTLRLRLGVFPGERFIELPRPPLASVTSLKYYDSDNVQQTVDAASLTEGYEVVTDELVGKLVLRDGASWPSPVYARADAIEVIFVAGYGAYTAVPETLRLAVLHLVAHYYENRVPVVQGTIVAPVPMHVESLLWGERVLSFG